jgi:hypothetical protein
MSEIRCKTRSGLAMAGMGLGCILFTLPTVARAKERDDTGFVPMLSGKDASGWETTGNWGFEQDGAVALRPTQRRLRLTPDYNVSRRLNPTTNRRIKTSQLE